MKYRFALLDLDGTLTDARPGIVNCILYALDRLDVPQPQADTLEWAVGPPLRDSLQRLLQTEDQTLVERALALYRERFTSIGWMENSVYEGVPEALRRVLGGGVWTILATSKPHVYANRILEHFGLAQFIIAVYGSEYDGARADKSSLIEWVVRKEALDPADCLMIGDREHDVYGARANGVDCLGVLYGYGSETELRGAGVVALASSPAEWADYVLG